MVSLAGLGIVPDLTFLETDYIAAAIVNVVALKSAVGFALFTTSHKCGILIVGVLGVVSTGLLVTPRVGVC